MNSASAEPTREELLAMAYVDGELGERERREFEALLPGRPDLAREVTQLSRLAVIARQMAAPEPMDHEWRRLELDPLQRTGTTVALVLLFVGGVGLLGWLAFELYRSDLPLVPKLLLAALLAGSALLFLLMLRARLRTLPYDPYTEIQR
jgi:anti-sigma factor RsiW